MKIKRKFSPITIVLETDEEWDMLWQTIEEAYPNYPRGSDIHKFLIDMSNQFTMGMEE
tara:strand:+ start:1147 stop:1320 length:174 start_codon:yes stop_codon:yes gene_type:complete